MVCILHGYYDVHPKMRFSLTPPPPKALHSSTITTAATATPRWTSNSINNSRNYSSAGSTATTTTTTTNTIKAKSDVVHQRHQHEYQTTANNNNYNHNGSVSNTDVRVDSNNCDRYKKMQRQEDTTNSNKPIVGQTEDESISDYKQWLHAMKLVARLPGGIPPEFRRKLWLSLADKYLKSKNVDWSKEEEKCFCEKWREDDEELGIQIVKDLHRTGSTLCTGPAGDVNQAKLKRILLGYARYNPEVGYCQGFNMLGALILQVMDKDETESMKVMIYLVEGILPPGYFCGSMVGLQADMAVFRELMQSKLPRLARHLQKLQGPVENAFEPPLTNVFTMQWFLTMFCTCLPMSCVLRVWDLVLIEGSDVLLRTALALWSLLEERVLSTRSADDFYGKMGSFSSELLNGHLIDSNGLIEKVVQLGPIQDIQKLRDKHLSSVMPLKAKQGINFYYDEDEPDMDDDSRLAVATVWGIPWGRRGSQGQSANTIAKQAAESKDRIALDISLLKKQYDRLRERQKQAHIILTTACSTARQSTGNTAAALPVNQLLSGRPAIITNRGRRGPPIGAIPPARKPSLPAVLQDKPLQKQLRRGETLQWRDSNLDSKRRRDSLTWKEIRAERAAMISSGSIDGLKSQKIRTKRLGKSDSSSYSEESEDEDSNNDKAISSSDTSVCDDDNAMPSKMARKSKLVLMKQRKLGPNTNTMENGERQRPKSWAPSNSDIPFVLMTADSPNHSADENTVKLGLSEDYIAEMTKEEENSATESDQMQMDMGKDLKWHSTPYSPLGNEDFGIKKSEPLHIEAGSNKALAPSSSSMSDVVIPDTSTPPISDVSEILAISKVLSPPIKTNFNESTNSLGSGDDGDVEETEKKQLGDEGVTNEYFERVNSTERPTKLELSYSLNEEDSIRDAYKDGPPSSEDHATESRVIEDHKDTCPENNESRHMDLLDHYSEKSSAACIAEAKSEISTNLQANESDTKHSELATSYKSLAAIKRRDPRRLTMTRSSTMEIEQHYQALEKRFSMEVAMKNKITSNETHNDVEKYRSYLASQEPNSEVEIIEARVSGTSGDNNDDVNTEEKKYEHYRIYEESAKLDNKYRPFQTLPSTGDGEGHVPYRMPELKAQGQISVSHERNFGIPYTVNIKEVNKQTETHYSYHQIPSPDDAHQREEYMIRSTNDNGNDQFLSKYKISNSKDLDEKREGYSIPSRIHEDCEKRFQSRYSTIDTKEKEVEVKRYRFTDSIHLSQDNKDEYKYRDLIGQAKGKDPSRPLIASNEKQSRFYSDSSPDCKDLEDGKREQYRVPPTGSSSEDLHGRTFQALSDRRDSELHSSTESPCEADKYQFYNPKSIPRSIEEQPSHRETYHIYPMFPSKGNEDDDISQDSKDSPLPPRKPRIPSTADLEERFENMIRDRSKQAPGMSDSDKGGTPRKTPPSSKGSPRRDTTNSSDRTREQTNQNVNTTGKTSGIQNDVGSKGKSKQRDSDSIDENDQEAEDGEEDISEARPTSSRTNISNESPSHRKKEPPDVESDYSEKDSEPPDEPGEDSNVQEGSEGSVTISGHDSPVSDSEPEIPENEEEVVEEEEEMEEQEPNVDEGVDDIVEESALVSRRQSELISSIASRRQSDLVSEDMAYSRRQSALSSSLSRRQSHRDDDEIFSQKSAKVNVGKKSPPSTEELEKRFEALEKQMSISKSEASEELLEESIPEPEREVEFDDRQSPDGYSELDQQAMANEDEEEEEGAEVEEESEEDHHQPEAAGDESEIAEELNEEIARANRIKANIIEAMKSSHHSDDENSESHSRAASKMAANVMQAMKSSKRQTDSESRSQQIASSVMEAMKTKSGRDGSDDTETKANKIKSSVIEAMKSSSALSSPDDDTQSRSHKMAANVREAMKKSAASATLPSHSDDEAEEERLARANRLKAEVIQAMTSSSVLPSPIEDEETRTQQMAANVMKAMKSSSSRKAVEEDSEKRTRSNRIKAGVLASMKSGCDQQSPEEPSKSQKMASNVMEAMRSSSTSRPPSSEEMEKRRSEKIKGDVVSSQKSPSEKLSAFESAAIKSKMATNVVTAMKSSSRKPTDKEGSEKLSRSDKIKAGIIASMKASPDDTPDTQKKSLAEVEAQEKRSRSDKIKAGIIASMKSPASEVPDTSSKKSIDAGKQSRSDKIKAGIIASMKSSSDQPTPNEIPESRKARESDGADKRSRSDKIKAGIIASMKATTDHPSPSDDKKSLSPVKSSKMASNVMEAMKASSSAHLSQEVEKLSRADKIKAEVISAMKSSSEHHSPTEEESSRKSTKMAANVMSAMKSSAKRSEAKRNEEEKIRKANKIKADVIEAMRSSSDRPDEETKTKKIATNVMEAMKSSKKSSPAAHKSPDEEKVRRANKIKADVVEAMRSTAHQDDPKKSAKMAVEAMKSARRSAAESSRQKSNKIHTPTSTRPSPKHEDEVESKFASSKAESLASSSSSRRSSEPPSTEDLEKRYEVLKRRISSRNFDTNKGASNNVAEGKDATAKTSPPSTDSLERRFERLQSESKMETKEKHTPKSPPKTKHSPIKKEAPSKIPIAPKEPEKPEPVVVDHSPSAKKTPSPESGTRSALIEELQSKLGTTPDGENIKPSSINPNRKTPPHPILRKSNTDETSETHATNANSLSGKYEPIHSSSRKMVRRFSDLPSRADLENRLQFLEEQLSKTLLKQRRASDSEVASTSRMRQGRPMPAHVSIGHVGKLESRVIELEKQLSASSKFKASGQEGKKSEDTAEASGSQMGLEIRADSVDVTGKELVRYSHFGEVEEQGFQSPINISINIHMTLSKEELGKAATQHLSRTDELSRRLLILEEQLKMSQRNIASASLSPPPATSQIVAIVAEPSPVGSQEVEEQEDEVKPSEYQEEPRATKVADENEKEEKHKEEITKTSSTIADETAKEEIRKNVEDSKPALEDHQPETIQEVVKEEQDSPAIEPAANTSSEDQSEVVEKATMKKPETQHKEDDFDRRLQILEEHMKNSRPLRASPETHTATHIPAKESVEKKDKPKSPIQSEPEKPKAEVILPQEQTAKLTEENSKTDTSKAEAPSPETKVDATEAKTSQTETTSSDKPMDSLQGTQMVPVEVNKKTLVLLLDNEPKAVKVRRLTRANTEELEDLFQALEKQLIERGQVKPEDIGLKGSEGIMSTKEMASLTKEIMQLSKSAKAEGNVEDDKPNSSKGKRKEEEEFDWGKDPIKHHLKKKTVYLPSTRELESRFRSLERQIKMLEDVEKIDVEQRLTEIERKIKLQYSLSHEKDLNRFLDLCEGKGLDDTPVMEETPPVTSKECPHSHHCSHHARRHQSPGRMIEPSEHLEHTHAHSCDHDHQCTTPSAAKKQHQSPVRTTDSTPARSTSKPTTEDLEYRFRALDLNKSSRPKTHHEPKREPIHPLEMLLDPSPEDIPTTGELEHRMRMLEEGRSTPSPSSRKSRSKSPSKAAGDQQRHESPSPSGLPTAQELEARLEALEKEQRFDFKMQKNYREFNQKLKDIISPSLSFDEFKATRSSSAESAKKGTTNVHRSPSPKVTITCKGDPNTCPKSIRFHEDDQQQQRCRDTMKPIPDSHGSCCPSTTSTSATVPAHLASSVQEGLGVMGIRLMRETSPLRRKGTHTGVPLRTGENINDQLNSIKNTIKSIDSLCEEKPYRTERCQQYIDSLCSDSTYFASKKFSYDDLRSSRHNSRSRSREYGGGGGGPSIRISDQSPGYVRSMGSADSIRSSSPLRASSPLQYHSNRDLRREVSPRRRRTEEDREENESRLLKKVI
ncbi:uncharacterized protein LOC142242914 isoform X2 [Haematobia irritans]|uniref:uncharacterized protein LOC142242914 isoform X2 n=1 Tax=Haematobia irritans TaxID=7368 RepID=UPI003F50276F